MGGWYAENGWNAIVTKHVQMGASLHSSRNQFAQQWACTARSIICNYNYARVSSQLNGRSRIGANAMVLLCRI